MDNPSDKQISFKQEFVNHLIWLGIVNTLFAYFSGQMEKGRVTTIGQIIHFVSGFFLFGFLFAFTKVLNRKFKNVFLSFIATLVFMLVVNFILLSIFGV
ncbi:MAG: hypothetical protein Q7S60_01535 [bacterium]|nr:hypothetical protein [bacterium]